MPMLEMDIRADETVEDLQLEGLHLLQKKKGFRFGMDSVLLAYFASIRPKDRVADFGTGSGILPLLLIGHRKGIAFDCFEIQPEIAEMAGRTMQMNHLPQVRIHLHDAAASPEILESCSIDAVICNPPYGKPGAALQNPNLQRAISRHQTDEMISGWFHAAFRILKGKGKLFVVYPAPRMLELMMDLKKANLEPKRVRLVYPSVEKPANLVLLEAVKDAKPGLHMLPPLIVCNEDGTLTNELKSVYNE